MAGARHDLEGSPERNPSPREGRLLAARGGERTAGQVASTWTLTT